MTDFSASTIVPDVFEITSGVFSDHRGAFVNAYRSHEIAYLKTWGTKPIQQVNFSFTDTVGTVRGLHMQAPPHSESKLVRCVRGRVWDVAVDLRVRSSAFGKWHSVELSPQSSNALLVPAGCAHGFQVLEPGSELLYLHSGAWVAEAETGVRFDDPDLSINWPLPPLGLSERDLALPLLKSWL